MYTEVKNVQVIQFKKNNILKWLLAVFKIHCSIDNEALSMGILVATTKRHEKKSFNQCFLLCHRWICICVMLWHKFQILWLAGDHRHLQKTTNTHCKRKKGQFAVSHKATGFLGKRRIYPISNTRFHLGSVYCYVVTRKETGSGPILPQTSNSQVRRKHYRLYKSKLLLAPGPILLKKGTICNQHKQERYSHENSIWGKWTMGDRAEDLLLIPLVYHAAIDVFNPVLKKRRFYFPTTEKFKYSDFCISYWQPLSPCYVCCEYPVLKCIFFSYI